MEKINIACCQIMPTSDKLVNLQKAEEAVRTQAASGANIVVLPEMFICPYANAQFKIAAETENGLTFKRMSELARSLQIVLLAGSIPEKENNELFNTSFVFGPDGNLLSKYRKAHLFDVAIEGGINFKESNVLNAGNQITVTETPFGRIGVAICFDVRFPEWFRLMVDAGAQIILVPAAFNMTTGPLHWELSLRSRAVDNQCFIAACSPARDVNASYYAWGHSMIVDPWGQILAECAECEESIMARIDLNEVETVRNQLPILKARRNDLYCIQKK